MSDTVPPHATASPVFGTALYAGNALPDGRTEEVAALISLALAT
jgi:hypothetical protein